MTGTPETEASGARATVRARPDPWCDRFEAELDAAGIPIALPHRACWNARFGPPRTFLVGVSDAADRARYGCGVDAIPVRSVPGHLVYRLERFTGGSRAAACSPAIQAVLARGRATWNVLRVEVGVLASTAEELTTLRDTLEALGFTPVVPPQRYRRTLRLELAGSAEDVFASLGRTARRNTRAALRAGAEIRPIADPAFAPALDRLERAAFDRTGGRFRPKDWPALIAFCREHPRLARLVGVFVGEDQSPAGLLGFAMAQAHGDHVEYANAGSVRRPDLKVPLAYPLLWDLIEWAHGIGAVWFDFGGVTSGDTAKAEDPLGGISRFKRYFGGREIEVGGEWACDLRPVRSRFATAVSRLAQRAVG